MWERTTVGAGYEKIWPCGQLALPSRLGEQE